MRYRAVRGLAPNDALVSARAGRFAAVHRTGDVSLEQLAGSPDWTFDTGLDLRRFARVAGLYAVRDQLLRGLDGTLLRQLAEWFDEAMVDHVLDDAAADDICVSVTMSRRDWLEIDDFESIGEDVIARSLSAQGSERALCERAYLAVIEVGQR
jgi:hypothetical protein